MTHMQQIRVVDILQSFISLALFLLSRRNDTIMVDTWTNPPSIIAVFRGVQIRVK